MPIPEFDHNNVIPPHLGNPTEYVHLSPYSCTTIELCEHFSTTTIRIKILKNFLEFRQQITRLGINEGFQWLDGSFVENIETSEQRDPKDLDVVTFYNGTFGKDFIEIQSRFPEFSDSSLSKQKYLLDHYIVDYTYKPLVTIEMTRYWIQLFTHNRNRVWKGILKLSLNTPFDDKVALDYLNSREAI